MQISPSICLRKNTKLANENLQVSEMSLFSPRPGSQASKDIHKSEAYCIIDQQMKKDNKSTGMELQNILAKECIVVRLDF